MAPLKNLLWESVIINFCIFSRWFIRQQFSIPYFTSWPRILTEEEKHILGFFNYGGIDDNSRLTSRGDLPNLTVK